MKSFLLFGICYSSMLFANSIETIGVYGTYGFSKLQLGITDFDNDLNYPPNLIKGKVGLGLKYGFYDFSLAFNLPQSQAASGIKGESKHFESLIDYWGDKYAFEGYLQYYEGFYLESDSSQTFPDLKAKKIGINVIRPFLNDKVTPKLINGKMNLNTSEVSEASLLIILSSYYTELESSESLVTNTAKDTFENVIGLSKGQFFAIIPAVGVAWTIHFENFYISPMANVGIGMTYAKYNVKSSSSFILEFAQAQASLLAGYNSDNIFFSTKLNYHSNHTTLHANRNPNAHKAFRVFFETTEISFKAGFYF